MPRERFRGGAMRYLPVRAVVYFHPLKGAKLTDLPLRQKRSIWTCRVRLEPMKLKTIEFAPSAMLDMERLAADSLGNAERYPKARDRYITPLPDLRETYATEVLLPVPVDPIESRIISW